MPPLPPVTDVVKVNLGWGIGNNANAESILHFGYSGSPPAVLDCETIASAIQSAAITHLGPLISAYSSIQHVTVLDLNSNTGNEGTGGTPTSGTLSGTYLSANACVVINHQIARRYRGGHPRSYCPFGVQASLSSAGQWSSTFRSTVLTDWTAFITACTSVTGGATALNEFVCVSYYNDKTLRVTPLVEPITGYVVRGRVGSQRRRTKTA